MEKFLRFYRASCHYGIDLTEEDRQAMEGDDPESYLRLPSEISREEFYRELYLARPVLEKRIKKAIQQTRLLCVVGPKGAGKTTVVGKVMDDFRHQGRRKFIVEMDVRSIYSEPRFRDEVLPRLKENPTEIIPFMEQRVSEQYDSMLFDPLAPRVKGRRPRSALYAFLLLRKEFMFTLFKDSRNAILDRFAHQTNLEISEGSDYSESLYSWIDENRVADDEVRRHLKEIDKNLDHRHYIEAARHIYGYNTQIVWYDNIDSLDGSVQLEMFHHLRRAHAGLSAYAMSVMAIRMESVKHYILSEEKAPPYADFLILHEKEQNDAIALGRLSSRKLQRIVEARFLYSLRRQREHIEQLTRAIADAPDSDEEKIRRLEHELEEVSPTISPMNLQILRKMSQLLLKQLDRQEAFGLANGSLRELLILHSETLDQYRRVYRIMSNEALEAEDWYLSTLLLRWLRRSQRIYVVGIYELVSRLEEWIAAKEQGKDPGGVACILEHVVATGLWNLQKNTVLGGIPQNPPTVKKLLERLTILGYSEEEIYNSIFELYTHGDSTGNVVDFCSESRIEDSSDISPSFHIFLTERGKCLTGRTCNTFGFLYESISMIREGLKSIDRSAKRVRPLDVHTEAAAELVLDFLCDLAWMYAIGMQQVAKRFRTAGYENWNKKYRHWFGIPRFQGEKEFVPKRLGGERVSRVERAIHFEALASSISIHFSFREKQQLPQYAQQIRKLRDLFRGYVNHLEKDTEKEPPNFRRTMNIGARKWNLQLEEEELERWSRQKKTTTQLKLTNG